MKRNSFNAANLLWLGERLLAAMVILISITVPCQSAAETALDTFSNATYGNQDGTENWSTDWVEEGDENTPYAGLFNIYDGKLHLNALAWISSSSGQITRGVDLSEATSAVLSFDYAEFATSFSHGWVETKVMVSADGGSSWQDLGPINNGDSGGSRNIDISPYAGSDTRIRFFVSWYDLWAFESMEIDNVQVQYEAGTTSPQVAYFPLEGDVVDSSGNGHDGTSQGAVDYDRAKVCDGVQLDGSGYLQVPDHSDFDIANELTVMAWLRPDSLSVAGHDNLYSFLSKDTNYEFHVQSNGSILWWWGDDSITTASGLITEEVWQHVAFVYSRFAGIMQIYVDGSLVASRSYSASLPMNNDPFYIGTDKATGGGEMSGRRFYGAIDEVRVYSEALSAKEISTLKNETDPCQVAIDHYEIIHDGSALTCAPEAVTVRACVDSACTSLYSEDVTIDLSPSGWVNGDSQTLSAGSGVFRLRHTTYGPVTGTVTLSVSSQDPVADSAPVCVDGTGGASCDMTFYEAGFLFDVPDHRACTTAADITIAAVRADPTAKECVGVESFANTTRKINFWSTYQDPVSGTQALQVNGNAIGGASPGTAVEIVFDGQAESNLESSLDIRYNDAGQLQLSAYFAGSGDEEDLVMTGSDSFVVAPDGLRVVATSDGTAPLDNATFSGSPLWAAGDNFYVEVAGVCSDGTVTENFSAETTLTAVTPPALVTGTLTGGPLNAVDYSSGVVQVDDVSYSEVGTVTIGAEVLNYLDSALDVTGSSDPVGRFTPHHFLTSLNTPQFATGCSDGSFTYLGQPFDYVTAPVITVTAQNLQNGTTLNYAGDWWKLSSGTLKDKKYLAATGSVDTSQLPAGDPTVTELPVGGVGLLTFSAGSGLSMDRGALTAPYDADISLEINVIDGDGIAATANPVRFGAATVGNGISFDKGKEMRWGRIILNNAYGSELLVLPMPLRAEYYNGTAFIPNVDDSCTSLPLAQLIRNNGSTTVVGDNTIAVGSGTTSASLSIPFNGGNANLSFSAPGEENVGFDDVTADLSLLDWLRFDWDDDGDHDDNPMGRATFGLYEGRPSLIYLRETYR